MDYYYFLDESGDHGLSYIDPNFPLFMLCGCLFRADHYSEAEKKVDAFKMKFFKTKSVILHSRDIRKCEGPFQVLFDLELKKAFYDDLNDLMKTSEFIIIGSGINKEKHIKQYGKATNDPYSLSMSFMMERVAFCLHRKDKSARVHIVAESRGRKEDVQLDAYVKSIIDLGTFYVTRAKMTRIFKSFKVRPKKDNVAGLQIADLAAYPLARHILRPEEPYPSFDIIESKLDCDYKGRYDGWGLKIFP
ncbi:MAG: DUF3800 domain-containing protein [Candidatus Omnitrophota bacterium]